MHSPHFTHFCRNCSSGRAPGGLINLSDARCRAGVSRKKGMAKIPRKEVNKSFRRERSMVSIFSAANFTGNTTTFVGQIAAQVKQYTHSELFQSSLGKGLACVWHWIVHNPQSMHLTLSILRSNKFHRDTSPSIAPNGQMYRHQNRSLVMLRRVMPNPFSSVCLRNRGKDRTWLCCTFLRQRITC